MVGCPLCAHGKRDSEACEVCDKVAPNGQECLIKDLEEILADAKAGQFGKFTNDRYPAPKLELAAQLLEMRDNVIKGKYD